MGVMLFRPGNTFTYEGVECEMEVFPVEQLEAQKQAGWCNDINDVYKEKEDEVKEDGLQEEIEIEEKTDYKKARKTKKAE